MKENFVRREILRLLLMWRWAVK